MKKHELRIEDLPEGVTQPSEAELDLLIGGAKPDGTMKKSWGASAEWIID